MTDAQLRALVRKANKHLAALSPEQQADHWRQQRESWVRGEIELGKWERARTRFNAPRVAADTDRGGDGE